VKSNHQVGDEFIPTIVCFNLPLIGNILLILMVIIWLMMVNNNLVGGAITILKNDGVRQWEG
jgi:hypothetical protein